LRHGEVAVRDFDEETLRRILAQLLPEFSEGSPHGDGVVVAFGAR
jgi:hypothetical protein